MSWTSLIYNAQGVIAIYGGDPPPLTDVRIREVRLQEDGPTVALRFDLPVFPDKAPKKWVAQGFNTVQLEISFGGIRSLGIEGLATEVVADIAISEGDGVTLVVASPAMPVEAAAQTAFLSKVSAYGDGKEM
ncbi:Imm50 family immunity protein [Streptomyces sp. BV129]|uniref:Imm50 family immunity protein n=1 Tax=Streptomyces sp. BV129 TaxID=2849671 RepID=UPI001C2E0B4F|nr:Imm50 family immunity protein [Streptomyces sp. BV129]MBV1948057.1 immunity 50 family protein [Streptomyces sp. BV129]